MIELWRRHGACGRVQRTSPWGSASYDFPVRGVYMLLLYEALRWRLASNTRWNGNGMVAAFRSPLGICQWEPDSVCRG